jgi:flagellar export protein FliJ
MSKYQFRLKTVQRLRGVHRDQRRVALAEAFQAEDVLAERRKSLASEQAELRSFQREAAVGKYLDVNRLLESQRYELILKTREQELDRQETMLASEVERRRQALVEANRDVRVLEQLEERQRQAHRREAQRMETKQLDEVAMIQQPRKQPV